MLYTAGLSALHPGSQSMQDYVCGNISGAVMANKKLSVILKREKNREGVKRQWQGVGECLVLSIMDSVFEGGIFSVKSFWWAGCGGLKSFMQEHYIMYILIKQCKHMIKIKNVASSFFSTFKLGDATVYFLSPHKERFYEN